VVQREKNMGKAAFLYGPRDIRVEEIPDQRPGPGELLLAVTAVGICGSDLHTYLNGEIGGVAAEQPLILGHEAAGTVLEIGPGAESAFHVGQAVAIDPGLPCYHCERCLDGEPNLCLHLQFLGLYPRHGALRERMVHPASATVPLPDGIDPLAGALLEPLGVALHANQLARIGVGDDVLVIGCGAIGLLLIRLARLAGARRIVASDQHAWRLDLARAYGADLVVDAGQTDVVAAVREATNGRGVDVALESAWVRDTAEQCVEAARNGGRVIVVGIPSEDSMTVRASTARRKGLTIKMSRRMKHTYGPSIKLVAGGAVDVASLASHRFSLDQTKEALETAAHYRHGVVRAMVLPAR
jgi:L-iditol 2-dehydrogenase